MEPMTTKSHVVTTAKVIGQVAVVYICEITYEGLDTMEEMVRVNVNVGKRDIKGMMSDRTSVYKEAIALARANAGSCSSPMHTEFECSPNKITFDQ